MDALAHCLPPLLQLRTKLQRSHWERRPKPGKSEQLVHVAIVTLHKCHFCWAAMCDPGQGHIHARVIEKLLQWHLLF